MYHRHTVPAVPPPCTYSAAAVPYVSPRTHVLATAVRDLPIVLPAMAVRIVPAVGRGICVVRAVSPTMAAHVVPAVYLCRTYFTCCTAHHGRLHCACYGPRRMRPPRHRRGHPRCTHRLLPPGPLQDPAEKNGVNKRFKRSKLRDHNFVVSYLWFSGPGRHMANIHSPTFTYERRVDAGCRFQTRAGRPCMPLRRKSSFVFAL